MDRRRFLKIVAATALVPTSALASSVWRGRAFGADISISLNGDKASNAAALKAARDTITRLENMFSIYNPNSSLSLLNRTGRLNAPPEFTRLIQSVDRIHAMTEGLFDPTVQPFFAKLFSVNRRLTPQETSALFERIGWSNVDVSGSYICFKKSDINMTLNGIAQGFATDRVAEILEAHGFQNAIVNIGEYRAGDEPIDIDVSDTHGLKLSEIKLQNAAVATSSRNGFMLPDGSHHIVHPAGETQPHWDTVSVIAADATRADGYSTALILSPQTRLAERLVQLGEIQSAIFKSTSGDIIKI